MKSTILILSSLVSVGLAAPAASVPTPPLPDWWISRISTPTPTPTPTPSGGPLLYPTQPARPHHRQLTWYCFADAASVKFCTYCEEGKEVDTSLGYQGGPYTCGTDALALPPTVKPVLAQVKPEDAGKQIDLSEYCFKDATGKEFCDSCEPGKEITKLPSAVGGPFYCNPVDMKKPAPLTSDELADLSKPPVLNPENTVFYCTTDFFKAQQCQYCEVGQWLDHVVGKIRTCGKDEGTGKNTWVPGQEALPPMASGVPVPAGVNVAF